MTIIKKEWSNLKGGKDRLVAVRQAYILTLG
jgi:hypothetical protein